MPTKKGGGGRQQNYNPRTGRFVKMGFVGLEKKVVSRKEKAREKEKNRREILYNRAKNTKDPLLFEVFCEIEAELPGIVQFVNEYKYDSFIGGQRELDIITRKCIIEVKSGVKPTKALRQFLSQKRYAEAKNKKYIVFAPSIPTMAKIQHKKSGITIISNKQDLITTIKEYEK